MTLDILSYLAGLFDGEGCISISVKNRKNGTIKHELIVQVSMVDEVPVKMFFDNFGGSFTKSKKDPPKHDIYHWRLSSVKAKTFLEIIEPYLLVRQKQARIAIQFQSGIRNTCKQTSLEELTRRSDLRVQLQGLNYGPNFIWPDGTVQEENHV